MTPFGRGDTGLSGLFIEREAVRSARRDLRVGVRGIRGIEEWGTYDSEHEGLSGRGRISRPTFSRVGKIWTTRSLQINIAAWSVRKTNQMCKHPVITSLIAASLRLGGPVGTVPDARAVRSTGANKLSNSVIYPDCHQT